MNIIDIINKLEDVCIDRYLDEMDFKIDFEDPNDLYLCDVMIEHLTKGDLNDVYESNQLDKYNEEDRLKILNYVSNNNDICFVENTPEYWLEAINYIDVDDYKFAVKKILDNIEFLIKIAINCGEDKLKLLNSLKDENIHINQSIVDSLRDNYMNDEEIIKLLNSKLSNSTIKNELIKSMENDISYVEDYRNLV